MISLKNDPKPHKDADAMMCEPCCDEPAYPYGLQIDLCDEVLQKLGMTALPKVGQVMTLTVRATVTSVSQYETAKPEADEQGSTSERRVGLQITDMDQPAAGGMYDKSKMNA